MCCSRGGAASAYLFAWLSSCLGSSAVSRPDISCKAQWTSDDDVRQSTIVCPLLLNADDSD